MIKRGLGARGRKKINTVAETGLKKKKKKKKRGGVEVDGALRKKKGEVIGDKGGILTPEALLSIESLY